MSSYNDHSSHLMVQTIIHGCQIWAQSGPDWHFFTEPKCTKIWSKTVRDLSHLLPIWPYWVQIWHSCAAWCRGQVSVWCDCQFTINWLTEHYSLSLYLVYSRSNHSLHDLYETWIVLTDNSVLLLAWIEGRDGLSLTKTCRNTLFRYFKDMSAFLLLICRVYYRLCTCNVNRHYSSHK